MLYWSKASSLGLRHKQEIIVSAQRCPVHTLHLLSTRTKNCTHGSTLMSVHFCFHPFYFWMFHSFKVYRTVCVYRGARKYSAELQQGINNKNCV